MTTLPRPLQIPVGFSLAIALGAAVAVVPGDLLWPLLALALGVPAFLGIVRWPWSMIYFIVFSAALTGLVRGVGGGTGVGVGASGLRWFAVTGLLCVLGLLRAHQVRLWPAIVPWAVFASWCAVWWLGTGAESAGLKDVAFYTLPLVVAVVGASLMEPEPARSRERLDRMLIASLAIPFLIYAITFPLGLVELTLNGPKGVLGPRPVATHALVILCVALPRWRYRLDNRRLGTVVLLLVLGLVMFTFSRLALAVAPLLLAIGTMRPARLVGMAGRVVLAGSMALLLLLSVPGVRDRMFNRPPESLSEVPQTVNLSGRDELWGPTLSRWIERPWFGWGPGLLRPAIADSKYWPAREVPPREYPPHNEYLHVLHDEGVIGLVLLLLALGVPMVWHHRRWTVADGRDPLVASAHLSGLLGLTVVAVNSAADNTLHYAPVTSLVFLLMASARCQELPPGGASDG